jgi:hypothetical protein
MERTRVKLLCITWWVGGTRVDHKGNGSGHGNAPSKPSRPKHRECQYTNGGTTNLSHEHIVLLHNHISENVRYQLLNARSCHGDEKGNTANGTKIVDKNMA